MLIFDSSIVFRTNRGRFKIKYFLEKKGPYLRDPEISYLTTIAYYSIPVLEPK